MSQYQNAWLKRRRQEWLATQGACVRCGSWKKLEVDHIDPEQKVSHRIWSLSEKRRLAELEKCQVLCHGCHLKKTAADRAAKVLHATLTMYRNGCRCRACKAVHAIRERLYRLGVTGKAMRLLVTECVTESEKR
jgi:hypothetical protein